MTITEDMVLPRDRRGRGFRPMVRVQLDLAKKRDQDTKLLVDDLKQRRALTPTFHKGLRLADDLEHRNLDALLELYPWVVDAIFRRLQHESGQLKMMQEMMREMFAEHGYGHSGPRITEKTELVAVEVEAQSGTNLAGFLDAFD